MSNSGHGPRRVMVDNTVRQEGRSSSGRSERDPGDRHSSQRKEESGPEMRERRNDYNKGDMRAPTSNSHHGHGSPRDNDQVKRSNTHSERVNRERTESSASTRSSRGHDREDRDSRGKDKPLPLPSDDNQRGTHQSATSRPYHESTKGNPAPPQTTFISLENTREEYTSSKRDRDHPSGKHSKDKPDAMGDHTPPETKKQPSPPGDQALKEGNAELKAAADITMDALSDVEMETVYAEARKQQEGEEEQIRKDLELALAEQQQEVDRARAESVDHRGSESDSDSGSETDESAGTPHPPESQGITSRIYSMVAGPATPQTKEDKLRSENRILKKNLKKVVNAYHESEYQLERAKKDSQKWYSEGHRVYMENGAMQRRMEMMDHERKAMMAELAHTKQQLSDAINLSEVRGKELKGAQVFLTKADSLSVSDVVQKVAALNEEIFQAGALLAETLIYQPLEGTIDEYTQHRQSIIIETRDDAYKLLGSYLVDLLATESMKPQEGPANQLLVQIVLLIALTRWCAAVCKPWIPDDKEKSLFLDDIYDAIRKDEDQAVAGRWRSLTRAHLDTSTKGWTEDVMRVITSITALAGWQTQTPDDLTQFEKRLSSIFKALREVRKATGEDVTSADLEVYAAYRGDPYEPTQMEDSYGDDRAGIAAQGGEKEKVIGPSGLGLRKVMVVKTGDVYQRRSEILSFPKVVLEKTVKEAIEPPPPPKPRKKKEKGEPGVGGNLMGKLGLT